LGPDRLEFFFGFHEGVEVVCLRGVFGKAFVVRIFYIDFGVDVS